MTNPVVTIAKMVQSLSDLRGTSMRMQGTAPNAVEINRALAKDAQLMARKISTVLVRGGAIKGQGRYIGIMPTGATAVHQTEELNELVDGLRVFFMGTGEPNEFSFTELQVATSDEIREAQERAIQANQERELKERLKKQLHTHYDQLYKALASLAGNSRHAYPWCNGECPYGTCKYYGGMESFLRSCDEAGQDMTTVMMEVVTKAS